MISTNMHQATPAPRGQRQSIGMVYEPARPLHVLRWISPETGNRCEYGTNLPERLSGKIDVLTNNGIYYTLTVE